MTTVTMTVRLPADVRDRLAGEAARAGLPVSTLARQRIERAPAAAAAPDGPEPLANEVECVFSGLPLASGVYRETALALARVVASGGPGAVPASRELLRVVHQAEHLFTPEPDDDFDDED